MKCAFVYLNMFTYFDAMYFFIMLTSFTFINFISFFNVEGIFYCKTYLKPLQKKNVKMTYKLKISIIRTTFCEVFGRLERDDCIISNFLSKILNKSKMTTFMNSL